MSASPTIARNAPNWRRTTSGQLNPTRSAVEEKHIAGCESCSDAIQKAPDDMLVRQPHEAVNQLPQAAPAAVASAGLETVDYPSPVAEELEVPDDLARHPRYRLLKLLGHGGMGRFTWPSTASCAGWLRSRSSTANTRPSRRWWNASGGRSAPPPSCTTQTSSAPTTPSRPAKRTSWSWSTSRASASTSLLARQGPLPVAEACEYVRQAALGLQHAHERGMVHRDVKPHNLIRAATAW